MAIRSTNAGRHMPTPARGGGATDPTRGYANADGPGGSTVDYGPHRGGFNFNGLTSPRWDDRDPAFDATPDMLARDAAARQPYIDRKNELLGGDQAYQAAKQAGDMRGMIAAMTRLKQQGQQDRFVAQGGTPETWQNRFDPNNNWPVPYSPLGVSSHGPGRPDFPAGGSPGGRTMPPPSAGTAAATAGASGGLPPMQNPMMQGYLGGGAGVPQGPGGFGPMGGGYNPGQSKSGMGQNPMAGPAASMGGDTGMYGGMQNTAGDFSRLFGGMPGPMMQNSEAGLFARLFGGGMGGGSLGGMQGFGYNPNAQMSPMGQWSMGQPFTRGVPY